MHISEALKGKPKPWFQGRKHKPETNAKIKASWTEEKREQARQRMLRRLEDRKWLEHLSFVFSGERNPRWQGGIAQKNYNNFYSTLKNEIRQRDNYTCQLCQATENELGYKLSIHHIDYDKEYSEEDNLVALCKRCNSLVNIDREEWTRFFKGRIQKVEHQPELSTGNTGGQDA